MELRETSPSPISYCMLEDLASASGCSSAEEHTIEVRNISEKYRTAFSAQHMTLSCNDSPSDVRSFLVVHIKHFAFTQT